MPKQDAPTLPGTTRTYDYYLVLLTRYPAGSGLLVQVHVVVGMVVEYLVSWVVLQKVPETGEKQRTAGTWYQDPVLPCLYSYLNEYLVLVPGNRTWHLYLVLVLVTGTCY